MRAIIGAVASGILFALLVLAFGVAVTAYLAIAGALVAIVLGAVDYVAVRSDDRERG